MGYARGSPLYGVTDQIKQLTPTQALTLVVTLTLPPLAFTLILTLQLFWQQQANRTDGHDGCVPDCCSCPYPGSPSPNLTPTGAHNPMLAPSPTPYPLALALALAIALALALALTLTLTLTESIIPLMMSLVLASMLLPNQSPDSEVRHRAGECYMEGAVLCYLLPNQSPDSEVCLRGCNPVDPGIPAPCSAAGHGEGPNPTRNHNSDPVFTVMRIVTPEIHSNPHRN